MRINEAKIKKDPLFAEDTLNDNNKVMKWVMIGHALKIIKLIMQIFNISTFTGIVFYLYAKYSKLMLEAYRKETDWERDDLNTLTFDAEYNISKYDNKLRVLITMIYFAFTTLSTIGLGDIHPKSDPERLFTIIIFVSGVSIFSYFLGNLNLIL